MDTPRNTSNHYYAYYISHDDFKEIIKTKKLPNISYNPFIILEPLTLFDSNSFNCAILLPNNQAGYFGTEDLSTSEGYNNSWSYVKFSELSNKDFYKDFLSRKPGVFTFNGVSFYKIIDIRKKVGNKVEMYLRLIEHLTYTEPNTAFMIMPFGSMKLNTFYKTNIQDFLKDKMQINVVRSDNFTDNDVIIDTIYDQIDKAEFIICEITECNKNVFFEIGYAKGVNKQIIFIAQRGIDLHFFDVGHIRRIDYNMTEPIELQEKLRDTINTIRGKGNPA
jgi:hypothetical protein